MSMSSATAGSLGGWAWARRPLSARQAALATMGLLAAWTICWHIPGHGLRGPDDAFYLTVAHFWRQGAPPYLFAFDVKPPGLFALLALVGPSQAGLESLMLACDLGTALCLWRIGLSLGVPVVGVFAAIGYPPLSQMLAANPGYPPLALATSAAFACAVSGMAWRRRVGLAGLAIGVAITIKQTAALEGLAVLWLLMREPEARAGRALAFAAAAAVAPLAFVVLFAAQGALAPLFADVVVAALRRTALERDSFAATLARFVSVQAKVWPLAAVAAVAVAQARRLLPGAPVGCAEGLALWTALSWLELWAQHARWLNYLGPTLAPDLLVAGAWIVVVLRGELVRRAALAALLAATIATAYPLRIWLFLEPAESPAVGATAQAILALKPAPQDRLLSIVKGEELNALVGLAPPTPYFHWLHLVCDFPGAGPSRLRGALAASPRFIVAPAEPSHPDCEDPVVWPLIREALAQGYGLAARNANLDLYERLPAR
jgi:hypothetical protein